MAYGEITDIEDKDRVFIFYGIKHYLDHYDIPYDRFGEEIYKGATIGRLHRELDGSQNWRYGLAANILTEMFNADAIEFAGVLMPKLMRARRIVRTKASLEEIEAAANEAPRHAREVRSFNDKEHAKYRLLLPHERVEYMKARSGFNEPIEEGKGRGVDGDVAQLSLITESVLDKIRKARAAEQKKERSRGPAGAR